MRDDGIVMRKEPPLGVRSNKLWSDQVCVVVVDGNDEASL